MNTSNTMTNAQIFKSEEFANLEKQAKAKGDAMYIINLKQGEILSDAKELFKSERGKELMKRDGEKYPTIEQFHAKYFGCIHYSYFKKLIQAHKVSDDVRKAYEQSSKNEVKTITKLLEFERKDANGDGDGESEVKVKAKQFKATIKDGKVIVDGDASISEIDLLIAELQRMKATKNSPKAA